MGSTVANEEKAVQVQGWAAEETVGCAESFSPCSCTMPGGLQGPPKAGPQPPAPRVSARSPMTWLWHVCSRDGSIYVGGVMVCDCCFCPLWKHPTASAQFCRSFQLGTKPDLSLDDQGIKAREVAFIHKEKHSQDIMASEGKDAFTLSPAPDLQLCGWALGNAILFPGQRLSAWTIGKDMNTSNTAYKFLLNV